MRYAAIALILLASTAAAPAQEPETARDYSDAAIFRFAHDFVEKKEAERKTLDLSGVGEVRVIAPRLRMVLKYLPFLAPLPGSRLKDLASFPDPFVLTNTEYAARVPSRMSDREWERLKDIGNP